MYKETFTIPNSNLSKFKALAKCAGAILLAVFPCSLPSSWSAVTVEYEYPEQLEALNDSYNHYTKPRKPALVG